MAEVQQAIAEVPRISPEEARQRVSSGQARLVCAYEDEAKCSRVKLEGALTLRELEARLDSIPKHQQLIFYCA